MTAANRYWEQFIESRPFATRPERTYVEAFSFGFGGDDGESAQAIAELVVDGIKNATGSLLWGYEFDDKPTPVVGDHWVVLGLHQRPICVIETTQVDVIPFDEVPAIYARLGGEWDRTIDSWREHYWSYIEQECERIGRETDPKAPLVMEQFECVYDEPPISDA